MSATREGTWLTRPPSVRSASDLMLSSPRTASAHAATRRSASRSISSAMSARDMLRARGAEGHPLLDALLELLPLRQLDVGEEAVNESDLVAAEAQPAEECVAAAEGQRVGDDLKLEVRRLVQLHDHVVEVFEDDERRDQAVVAAAAGARQKVEVIVVVVGDELVEIVLTDHLGRSPGRNFREAPGRGNERDSLRSRAPKGRTLRLVIFSSGFLSASGDSGGKPRRHQPNTA